MKWYIHGLRNYAQFAGRASKTEFLGFLVIHIIVFLVLRIIDNLTGDFNLFIRYGILLELYFLATIIPFAAVAVRRIHDTGRSGRDLIVIGGLFVLYLLLIQSIIDGIIRFLAIENLDVIETYGVFIALIVFAALFVYFMYFMLVDSQPGVNPYGENPNEQMK